MSAVLPHYKSGPANYQAFTLIYGGQWVMNHSITPGSTDLTVTLATPSVNYALGVAGNDAAPIATQTGAANTYGQPLIDLSVLTDYVSVYYGGVDIWCWYDGATNPGAPVMISPTGANAGCVRQYVAGTPDIIVGRCTHPGGISAGMLTQQIGGQGTAAYFLGRCRVTI